MSGRAGSIVVGTSAGAKLPLPAAAAGGGARANASKTAAAAVQVTRAPHEAKPAEGAVARDTGTRGECPTTIMMLQTVTDAIHDLLFMLSRRRSRSRGISIFVTVNHATFNFQVGETTSWPPMLLPSQKKKNLSCQRGHQAPRPQCGSSCGGWRRGAQPSWPRHIQSPNLQPTPCSPKGDSPHPPWSRRFQQQSAEANATRTSCDPRQHGRRHASKLKHEHQHHAN